MTFVEGLAVSTLSRLKRAEKSWIELQKRTRQLSQNISSELAAIRKYRRKKERAAQ